MNVENVKSDYNSDSDDEDKFNVPSGLPTMAVSCNESLTDKNLPSTSSGTPRRGLIRIPSRHMSSDTEHVLIKVGNSKSRSFDLGDDEAKPSNTHLLTRARSAMMKFRPESTIQTAPKGLARQGSWIDHKAALLDDEDEDEAVNIKDEEIQLAIKLETQRMNYNEDMFSSLQPADKDEVEILESSGYTFQEAIEVIFNRKHGLEVMPVPERKYSNQSMSSVGMDSPTAMMLKKKQEKEAKKTLKKSSFTYKSNYNMNTSAYQSMPMSAYQTPLIGSFYAAPTTMPPPYPLDSSWIEEYRINCLSNCTEAEQIRLSMMESKQEERCAIGMFDALRPEDKEEVTFYLALGYRFENIALYFFQRRYEPDALESNPDAMAMMADYQEQRQPQPQIQPQPILTTRNSSFMTNQYYDVNDNNGGYSRTSSFHNLPPPPPVAPAPPPGAPGMSYADSMLQNRLGQLAQSQQQLQQRQGAAPPSMMRPLHQTSFRANNNSFTLSQQQSSFTASSSHNGSYQNMMYVTAPTTPAMPPGRPGMPGKAPSFADMMLQSRLDRLAQESAMIQHQQQLQQQYQQPAPGEYDDFLALDNSQKVDQVYDEEEVEDEEEHQQPQQFIPQWISRGSQ